MSSFSKVLIKNQSNPHEISYRAKQSTKEKTKQNRREGVGRERRQSQ